MGDGILGFRWIAGVALAAVVANSCGMAAPTEPTSPTSEAPRTVTQIIMIMEGHAVPEELAIAVGERVSFMNHDRSTYTIAGGREPSRPDCPEVNVVGVLTSGDTRTTEPFTTAKTCEFHVSQDQSALLTGRIIIR
jgi:plastocyanin